MAIVYLLISVALFLYSVILLDLLHYNRLTALSGVLLSLSETSSWIHGLTKPRAWSSFLDRYLAPWIEPTHVYREFSAAALSRARDDAPVFHTRI